MSVQSPRRNPVPFGTYLLLDRINIGGMAEVWRGKSFGAEGFERMVAIKRILPNIAEEPDFKSMFIDEAKLSVLLSHANIAQVYELGELHGSLYIAMEYVAGKDLRFVFDRARKQQVPLPIPLVCHVIQRAAEGLDYAHRKRDQAGRELNIVHRDVSPQNILLSYDGEVKVIDFGIAKAAGWGTTTQTGVLKGKFGYMSPEQVLGQKVDRRSDVFALGVCFYELLTGERLFQGESDFSVLEKVANVDVQPSRPSLQGLPQDLSRIVSRALARSVEERYAFASDLADDLERYLHTSGRYFGRKDLMGFMHDAFGEDIDKELARQKDYAAVSATPEILEELSRGRLPQRPPRTHSGEMPLPPIPPDASVPEAQQTAAGSSRGQRAQAMRASTELETATEGPPEPPEATAPGAAGPEAALPERTDPGTRPEAVGPRTHTGPTPTSDAAVLHLDTHVGPAPEPQVDLALGRASTQVGPAPVRPSPGIADGDTRIGPAPQAPATRDAPRRRQTVGMPIPGILTMETHVGAMPLPPAPAAEAGADPSEDSTTGSGGDPRRRAPSTDARVENGAAGDPGQDDDRPDAEEAATLAAPARLTPGSADATLASPSRMAELAEETRPIPSSLTEDRPRSRRPDAVVAGAASTETRPLASSVEEGADTLATPSRLTEDTVAGVSVGPARSARSEGARAAAGEAPGRRRVHRGAREKGAGSAEPLDAATRDPEASELEEVTDARGRRRRGGASAGDADAPEDTDAEGRRPEAAADASQAYAAVAEEDTDAARRYGGLPEDATDAGLRDRTRGASRRPQAAAATAFDDEEHADDEAEDDPHGLEDDGLVDDVEDPEAQAYLVDPETYPRPQKAGRPRTLPVGATRFDGLFDAKARRFTRRDLWLAGVAGAAVALVLTLLVSIVSGPRDTGLILVEVVGVPPTKTTVRLEGKELPRTLEFPIRAPAPLGEVEVELSAEGYRPAKHLVRLTQPGEVAELRTSLEPL